MRRPLCGSLWLLAVLIGPCIAPAQAYLANDRWSRTATNFLTSTGSQGTPITLTWSFAPDNTRIPGNVFPTFARSNLISFLDTNWGSGPGGGDLTLRPWFPLFEQSINRLSQLAGVTYVYEPQDDAQNFGDANLARGVLGVRGDVRIGGKSFGSGSNILAANFYPDYGEMMINTDYSSYFLNSANGYRAFRNVIMHEAMHGLGIEHVESTSARFLMEPFANTAFEGPQLDDLLAIQRNYGDVFERNGGNDTPSTAMYMGEVNPAQPISLGALGDSTQILPDQIDFLSIDDNSDTDFFRFSLVAPLDVSLTITPRGTTYLVGPEDGAQSLVDSRALSDLALALFDSSGTTILQSVNQNLAGSGEAIFGSLLPGTYFARVKGVANDVQFYGLTIAAGLPVPEPTAAVLMIVGLLATCCRRWPHRAADSAIICGPPADCDTIEGGTR